MRNTIQKLWTVWGFIIAFLLAGGTTFVLFADVLPTEAYPYAVGEAGYYWLFTIALFTKLQGLLNGKN